MKVDKANECKKRRGRKCEKDDVYIKRGNEKIEGIKLRLKTAKQDGMSVKERKKLRCKVSAHEHRIKKKIEASTLNTILKTKDAKYLDLCNILISRLSPDHDTFNLITNDFENHFKLKRIKIDENDFKSLY